MTIILQDYKYNGSDRCNTWMCSNGDVAQSRNRHITQTQLTTIAGLTATVADDEVTVLVYDIFTTADMVSATSGGTFSGNVTHSGTVTVDDTTDSSSTTTGSIQTDGGEILQKMFIGDDLRFLNQIWYI